LSAPRRAREPETQSAATEGFAAAVAAYLLWGVFPLYLRPLLGVPPLQIIAHRIVWSSLLVVALLALRAEIGKLRAALADPPLCRRLALTATLISINWLTYVWGVSHARVVETSLGYFINPLVSVLLGVVVLGERLARLQWLAVAVAATAVAVLTVAAHGPPWIALILAVSFALYGLLRKMMSVDALPGLGAETLLLAPIALAYLIWCEAQGTGAFAHTTWLRDALLIGGGPVTAVPLFLFAYGARRIPYSTVGLLQYLSPTLQLACGVFVFGEPFTGARAGGFALIWLALLIFAADGLRRARRRNA
jgi:chloramphenicol-sensitive protein RarD